MHQSFYRILTLLSGLILFFSCQSTPEDHPSSHAIKSQNQIVVQFRGNLSSPEYDSIVNELTLYQNETFDLHQVDRIAEHHLNEKDHKGIYTYLSDSTQLALYTEDGILMLRFLLTDQGLIPMTVNGDKLMDSTSVWRKNDNIQQ